VDDDHEDDDDHGQALPLDAGDALDGVICAGDKDWYAFWVDAGDVLSATITFDGAAGDLDLELRNSVLTLVDASTGAADSETVSHAPRDFAGTLFLVVQGRSGAQGAYALTTSLASPPPPSDSCGDGACGTGESCDGRYGTTSCAADCAGVTGGKPAKRFCYVAGACEGPGC
jgi:hypothetical protein